MTKDDSQSRFERLVARVEVQQERAEQYSARVAQLEGLAADRWGQVEKLLDHADLLQDKIDLLEGRQSVTLKALITGLFTAVGAIGYVTTDPKTLWIAIPALFSWLVVFGHVSRGAKNTIERDTRALGAITSLLSQTETALFYQGEFSSLEMAHFRIRLSRFRIAPPAIVAEPIRHPPVDEVALRQMVEKASARVRITHLETMGEGRSLLEDNEALIKENVALTNDLLDELDDEQLNELDGDIVRLEHALSRAKES